MPQSFKSFKEFFRSIQILHIAMFMGMALIMIVLKFIVGIEDQSAGDFLFPIIGIGMAMAGLIVGHLLFTHKINQLKRSNLAVRDRLTAYREAFIIKLALLEGPALVCIILHFLNGNPLLFYTYLFMLAMFGFARPTEKGILEELRLHEEDFSNTI